MTAAQRHASCARCNVGANVDTYSSAGAINLRNISWHVTLSAPNKTVYAARLLQKVLCHCAMLDAILMPEDVWRFFLEANAMYNSKIAQQGSALLLLSMHQIRATVAQLLTKTAMYQ